MPLYPFHLGSAMLAAAMLVLSPGYVATGHAAPAGTRQLVKIENFAFTPSDLKVAAGTTVVFENDDDIPHEVVAIDGSFRSKALDTGDTYAFTFVKAGDFPYFCGIHPHMQGKVTVTP
jgi:plastocyanin